MNIRWIWPQISDKVSARGAVKDGCWAALFIVFFDVVVAVYSLSTSQKLAGHYDAWILVDAGLFGIVAWRLWRNSRAWAVVGLLLMGLEIEDKLQNAKSTFGIITVILFLAFINAARGAFAFHKYSAQEASLRETMDVAMPPGHASE